MGGWLSGLRRRRAKTADDDAPYIEPPYLEGLNDLGEVLLGIEIALETPERYSTETLQSLAREIAASAERHGVYEPLE